MVGIGLVELAILGGGALVVIVVITGTLFLAAGGRKDESRPPGLLHLSPGWKSSRPACRAPPVRVGSGRRAADFHRHGKPASGCNFPTCRANFGCPRRPVVWYPASRLPPYIPSQYSRHGQNFPAPILLFDVAGDGVLRPRSGG